MWRAHPARTDFEPVPALIRKVAAKARAERSAPSAMRKPKGVTFEKPGDYRRESTPSRSIPCPASPSSISTPTIPSPNGPVARPCKRATAKNATEYLDAVLEANARIASKPFKSMAEASSWPNSNKPASRQEPAPLRLPPRSPKLNGAVERCNGAWRYEFYACADLPMQQYEAGSHENGRRLPENLYNHHRPHAALAGKTPAEYLRYPPSQRNSPGLICPEPGQRLAGANSPVYTRADRLCGHVGV